MGSFPLLITLAPKKLNRTVPVRARTQGLQHSLEAVAAPSELSSAFRLGHVPHHKYTETSKNIFYHICHISLVLIKMISFVELEKLQI